ncbi:hypothetical protein D3C84_260930 [compost metagenome]
MVDAVDQGVALGHQAGDHQAGGGPQVGRHDWRALELRYAGDDGGVAFDQDLRAHAVHFIDVHEAVLEHGLDHRTGAFGHGVHGDELGLHVGGERRIGRGTKVDRLRPVTLHVQLDPVVAGVDVGTGLFQLLQHGFEDGRIGVLELDAATGGSSGHQVGAGFDTVGHHVVARAPQAFDAIDGDGVGAGALNLRAHGDQAVGQVDHFRFAGGVLQHAPAVGQGRGHHDVLGTGHADGIEEEVGATQATGRSLGLDVAAFDVDLRTHGLEAADVQVDRTRTDGAATGQGHFGLTETGHHRAEHQDGRTHGLDQLVRRHQGLDAAGVDFDRQLLVDHRLHAHATEEFDHGGDVMQMRQVGHGDRGVGQEGGGQDRQRGVLGAGNADLAIEALTAGNNQFVHSSLGCGAQERSAQAARLKNFMVTAWMLPSAIQGFRWA